MTKSRHPAEAGEDPGYAGKEPDAWVTTMMHRVNCRGQEQQC